MQAGVLAVVILRVVRAGQRGGNANRNTAAEIVGADIIQEPSQEHSIGTQLLRGE